MVEVYLNSKYVGTVENAKDFVEQIKIERRKSVIDNNVNVFHNEKTDDVFIESSKGRARRPLIVIKGGIEFSQIEPTGPDIAQDCCLFILV